MDTAKVAKDYYVSSQSGLLIPNREYGARKLIQVTNIPSVSVSRQPRLLRSASGSGGGGAPRGKFEAHDQADASAATIAPEHKPIRVRRVSYESGTSYCTQQVIMKSSTKQWIHPPDTLLKGHILYNVKFLGECAVDQPKGTDVVKEAIRKMKFNKHIKRAEGRKPPKVELTISADGLTVQEPKSKMILHQYPLHRISYCADDKSDKKMFTFIAKAATTNDHYCYVFDSDKCAEEITLTVGQAFDLAYKRFLESGSPAGNDVDYKKQYLVMQRRIQSLQFENDALRKRVAELEKLKDRSDLEEYMNNNQLNTLTSISLNLRESTSTDEDDNQSSTDDYEPPKQKKSSVGRRLEGLIFDGDTTQINGSHAAAQQSAAPVLSPPPPSTRSLRQQIQSGVIAPTRKMSYPLVGPRQTAEVMAGNPFVNPRASPVAVDPFGMGAFNPANKAQTSGGSPFDQELMDIQAGFSRGLSFGTDDFNLDDLDPLSQRL